jgi:type II protein arginine methyltransferase
MNPAVAGAAQDVVSLNGYADRVAVVAKRSTELDAEADMGGRADVLVSEIVSNDLLSQNALAVMTDAVDRLLKPGAAVIPESGRIRVALAWWDGLDERRLGSVAGFDMDPFNALDRLPFRLKAGDPGLRLRSAAADLFDFDFASGGPYAPGSATRELHADGGRINGVVQWIHLSLDAQDSYENKPAPGTSSCWALLFQPLQREAAPQENEAVRVHGSHSLDKVRVWTDI